MGFETPTSDLKIYPFKHPELLPHEMRMNVTKSGMCGTDTHRGRMEWGTRTWYPLVPGHEIVGEVSALGEEVKGYDIGQRVGFGPFNDACFKCETCTSGHNENCPNFGITYDPNWGGWSTSFQDSHKFYIPIPDGLSDEHAAPILCAGITMYSPLKDHGFQGAKVAIVGIGGLGHLGIKYAAHLGMEVT
jgi:D-arabinose 1-dehydrogenase-like Zn-dependent alcohol dehydrogenase